MFASLPLLSLPARTREEKPETFRWRQPWVRGVGLKRASLGLRREALERSHWALSQRSGASVDQPEVTSQKVDCRGDFQRLLREPPASGSIRKPGVSRIFPRKESSFHKVDEIKKRAFSKASSKAGEKPGRTGNSQGAKSGNRRSSEVRPFRAGRHRKMEIDQMAKQPAKKAPVKAPAKKPSGGANVPATRQQQDVTQGDYSQFEQYEGGGLQNVTGRDLLIPRITILQSLSPQLNSRKAEFIEGAKVGDICDVGTNEIFESPLKVLPVIFVKQWLEWAPRGTGGLQHIHQTKDILQFTKRNAQGEGPFLDNGNLIAETAQFYVLNLSAMGRRSFIPMASTGLKTAHGWLTRVQNEKVARADGSGYFRPPFYFRTYDLHVVEYNNAKGDWLGWRVDTGHIISGEPHHDPHPEWEFLLEEARSFEKSILAGEARGDVASMRDDAGGGGGGRADTTEAF